MPITVVVGGQFGSEGKGKVAHFIAKEAGARYAVRVGGTNSGHTVVDGGGRAVVFRHLPTACLIPKVVSVIPTGHYIHVPTILNEIGLAGLDARQLVVDPHAWVITDDDIAKEVQSGLGSAIGSTTTGTGAALVRRIERAGGGTFAKDVPELKRYIGYTSELLADGLRKRERVVVEGTQGFGLSLLHSRSYPYCTSRDTTAAGFISEAGLSPLDVDDVVLVIRAFPIRVAGTSGDLPNETTWLDVGLSAGLGENLVEHTTVTRRIRRVARFDRAVVIAAITHNRPTRIVLNHLDYVDVRCSREHRITGKTLDFLRTVESHIGRSIDLVGFGPGHLTRRDPSLRLVRND
jgi:adenylosuccinate synthase